MEQWKGATRRVIVKRRKGVIEKWRRGVSLKRMRETVDTPSRQCSLSFARLGAYGTDDGTRSDGRRSSREDGDGCRRF